MAVNGAFAGALHRVLQRLIVHGHLTVAWPDGHATTYGTEAAPIASLRLHDAGAVRGMLIDPALALGELYMDGRLTVAPDSLDALMDVFGVNIANRRAVVHPGLRLRLWLGLARRRLDQYNPRPRARRNVAHHYDLDRRLYELVLDPDLQYSCAYFRTGSETLEQAQQAKMAHIAAKLCLDRPDLRVLDIGCGWGGFALYLARTHGCHVTGITLSTEQLHVAQARTEAEGLAGRVHFRLLDYRDLTGTYDRIVSVGMFEHVGVNHYPAFFRTLARTLAPGGVALLHTIGRAAPAANTDPWLAKYIFPGGYSPSLGEMMPALEASGLWTTDVEVLRLHYAQTLRHWSQRFASHRTRIAALYDERFCRMFEYYLAISELAFTRLGSLNLQIQIAHRQTAVPLTRDYLAGS